MQQYIQVELRDGNDILKILEFYDPNSRFEKEKIQKIVESAIVELKETNSKWTIDDFIKLMGYYGYFLTEIKPHHIIRVEMDKCEYKP